MGRALNDTLGPTLGVLISDLLAQKKREKRFPTSIVILVYRQKSLMPLIDFVVGLGYY